MRCGTGDGLAVEPGDGAPGAALDAREPEAPAERDRGLLRAGARQLERLVLVREQDVDPGDELEDAVGANPADELGRRDVEREPRRPRALDRGPRRLLG